MGVARFAWVQSAWPARCPARRCSPTPRATRWACCATVASGELVAPCCIPAASLLLLLRRRPCMQAALAPLRPPASSLPSPVARPVVFPCRNRYSIHAAFAQDGSQARLRGNSEILLPPDRYRSRPRLVADATQHLVECRRELEHAQARLAELQVAERAAHGAATAAVQEHAAAKRQLQEATQAKAAMDSQYQEALIRQPLDFGGGAGTGETMQRLAQLGRGVLEAEVRRGQGRAGQGRGWPAGQAPQVAACRVASCAVPLRALAPHPHIPTRPALLFRRRSNETWLPTASSQSRTRWPAWWRGSTS